jgi:nucleoside diphosphate kinase
MHQLVSSLSNSKRDQNGNMEIACVILKPDTVKDGRKDLIIDYLRKYSCENGLMMVEGCSILPEISNKMINAHFEGEAKIKEVGEKVLLAFSRMGIPEEEMNSILKRHNLDPKDTISIGNWVRNVEVNTHKGACPYILVFAGLDAISKLFKIRGGSDPIWAQEGTLRKMFSNGMSIVDMFDGKNGKSIDNVLHIPDTVEEVDRILATALGKSYQEYLNIINQNLSMMRR